MINLLISFIILSIGSTYAQTTMSSLSMKKQKSDSTLTNLKVSLSTSLYSDLKESNDEDKSFYTTVSPVLSYLIDSKNILSLNVPLKKDLSSSYETTFNLDSRLTYTRQKVYEGDYLNFSPSISYVYPTTQKSKRLQDMYAAVELNPILILDLREWVSNLNFRFNPRYKHSFHKYTSDRAGNTLTERNLINFLTLSYSFQEKYSASYTLLYVKSWRYDGVEKNDSYLSVSELAYTVNNKLSLSVGIETGGRLVSPEEGEEENIEIFDANTSEIYFGANYKF